MRLSKQTAKAAAWGWAVALLGMNTVGFPRTVAAWSWAWEQIDRKD